MQEGWRIYLMYGKGEVKNRGALTPDNLLYKMSLWWAAMCGCDPTVGAVDVIQQMLQSGLYFPVTQWVMPTGGAGLDQERLETLFNVAKNFEATTRSDVRMIFMCPDHRYNDLHFEMAAQFPGATTLRAWQQEVVDKVSVDIVPFSGAERIINWYFEEVGNVGKTFMSRFLAVHFNAIRINGCMKKDDMLHTLMRKMSPRVKVVVFDVPRSTSLRPDLKYDIYEVMEQLCDGHVSSGKYESNTMPIQPVHIIVFSNSKPRRGMMSDDRWNIRKIVEADQPTVADTFMDVEDAEDGYTYSSDELEAVMLDINRDEMRRHSDEMRKHSKSRSASPPARTPPPESDPTVDAARTPPPESDPNVDAVDALQMLHNRDAPITPSPGKRRRRARPNLDAA